MRWLLAPFYDRFMAPSEHVFLGDWRRELLAHAEGRVLEIGAGTGVNLAHYPDSVESLLACEPDPGMARRLRGRLAFGPADVEVVSAPAERLPAADASVDTVVSTLVLCTVRDLDASLAEVRRVLKPGGRLLFLEHVANEEEPWVERLQKLASPPWSLVAGGCKLARRTGAAIERAGFAFEQLQRSGMPGGPLVSRAIRGVARP